MKYIILTLFLIFSSFSISYALDQSVLGTTSDVDFVTESREDKSGRKNGVDLYAYNRGYRNMEVKITLTQAENVTNQLKDAWVFIPAGERISLGYVIQKDSTKAFNWWVDWMVREAN